MMGERGKRNKGRIDRIVKAVQDGHAEAEREAEELREFERLKHTISRKIDASEKIDLGRKQEQQALDWYNRNYQQNFQEPLIKMSAGSGLAYTTAQTTGTHVHTHSHGPIVPQQHSHSPVFVTPQQHASQIYDMEALARAAQQLYEAEQERLALVTCAWCGKALATTEERDEHEEECGL